MTTTLAALRPVYTTRSAPSDTPEEHALTPRTQERLESVFEPRPASHPGKDAGHLLPHAGPALAKPVTRPSQRRAFSVQAPPVRVSAEK